MTTRADIVSLITNNVPYEKARPVLLSGISSHSLITKVASLEAMILKYNCHDFVLAYVNSSLQKSSTIDIIAALSVLPNLPMCGAAYQGNCVELLYHSDVGVSHAAVVALREQCCSAAVSECIQPKDIEHLFSLPNSDIAMLALDIVGCTRIYNEKIENIIDYIINDKQVAHEVADRAVVAKQKIASRVR